MKYKLPTKIKSDFAGYKSLVKLYHQTKDLFLNNVEIDFSGTTWFEANLSAVLGGIINKIERNLNDVVLTDFNPKIKDILERNHFLSHFGGRQLPDAKETTIKYRKFKTTDEKIFKNYLDTELLSKQDMPNMSPALRKKVNESIFEIFNNAVIHGGCSNIFSCGQYFPQKLHLDFTIMNFGNTIKENVNEYLGTKKSSVDSIRWALIEGNTTKSGAIPGGLGLGLICKFLKKNKGKIQIISCNGFWEQKKGVIFADEFENEFPGTIVNLEFNINDPSYYYLASEIDFVEEIF